MSEIARFQPRARIEALERQQIAARVEEWRLQRHREKRQADTLLWALALALVVSLGWALAS